jgi:hypothetical protein
MPVYGPRSNAEAVGYAAGAGGTVTQWGDKSAGVTLNKACGQIVLHSAALASGGVVSFALANSMVEMHDVVLVSVAGGGSTAAYAVAVDQVTPGACRISLRNLSGGALAEALQLNFAVLKGAAA